MDVKSPESIEAMRIYEAVGRPPVCPRCSAWDGPRLPMCADRGWRHYESCGRTRYADDLCETCANPAHRHDRETTAEEADR